MRRWLLVILALVAFSCAHTNRLRDRATVDDPVRDWYEAGGIGEEWRLPADVLDEKIARSVLDFNGDGRDDIALSYPPWWGNAGGVWQIYLAGDSGRYYRYDQLFFRPGVLRIEPVEPGETRLTFYHRMGANGGGLIMYRVMPPRPIEELGGEELSLVTDEGQARFQELFGDVMRSQHIEYCVLGDYLKGNANWSRDYRE